MKISGRDEGRYQRGVRNFVVFGFLLVAMAANIMMPLWLRRSKRKTLPTVRDKMFAALVRQEPGYFDLSENATARSQAASKRRDSYQREDRRPNSAHAHHNFRTCGWPDNSLCVLLARGFGVFATLPFMGAGWLYSTSHDGTGNAEEEMGEAGAVVGDHFGVVKTVASLSLRDIYREVQ